MEYLFYMSALLNQSIFITLARRDELDCLEIRHPQFSADLLLQGAQLIYFAPAGDSNWLWLSETAGYKQGVSLRGGIPLCWPWFGNAQMNPEAVKARIFRPETAPAHGFVRSRPWHLTSLQETDSSVSLSLAPDNTDDPQWQSSQPLTLSAGFVFCQDGISIRLTTHNHGPESVTFSQALHSYFPTSDIRQTAISGADGARYLDTLDGWSEQRQQGDIRFRGETDRIYSAAGPFTLSTPQYRRILQSDGSHSAVVWNPWEDKARCLSQFADDAYLRMFCVETANAAADAVTLNAGTSHSLQLRLSAS